MSIYNESGAFNAAVNDTTGKGRYSASGALRIQLVSGSSYVGLYAADGAMNVVIDPTGKGIYHPSGAIRGVSADALSRGLYAPNGAYYFAGLFSPLNLFSAGEQGVWYDPSDFTTMFQDSAGVTPVTAVEQPVELILDKSKGLVPGPELVTNGDFSSPTTTGWVSLGSATLSVVSEELNINTSTGSNFPGGSYTITTVVGRTYNILLTARRTATFSACNVYLRDSGGNFLTTLPAIGTTNTTYNFVFVARQTSTSIQIFEFTSSNGTGTIFVDNISAKELPGNHASQSTSASRPVLSARVNQLLATDTLSTQNVTTLAATYTLAFSGTGTVTASGTNIGVYTAGSNSLVCTAGTLTLTVAGSVTFADLRVTNDGVSLPAYQRVTTSTDYDTTGFPYYLFFDGTDDSLATATFTPGTDKVQVFAGLRKLRDSATGIFAEMGTTGTQNGVITFAAPSSSGANSYRFSSRGTTSGNAGTGTFAAAPNTSVLTGLGDIAGDISTIRRNGSVVETSTADQGTGNFLAYTFYIGRRGGTTLSFNGRIYSLIIRFGANLDAATISNTETWVNGKTGAY